jgi:peptidoglycan/xylan/chitin deacetylase (PgdA/CDA1 family)
MFRHTLPPFTSWLFPSLVWQVPTSGFDVYLTFDDGPHPSITDEVLAILARYQAKATFFCVGNNAVKYPEVVNRLRAQGHALGNHTHHHLNGWKTNNKQYLQDIITCAEVLPSKLFRPPYGRITPSQIKLLKNDFDIIMWSILTRDYDRNLPVHTALHQCKKAMTPGSILVMHDSEKAYKNLINMLPQILDYGVSNGFQFKALNQ